MINVCVAIEQGVRFMDEETIGYAASHILGVVHIRLVMALERETNRGSYEDIVKLKEYLDREINRLYYANSSPPTE